MTARLAALLAVLGACGGNTGGTCQFDSDCGGGEICARSEQCLAPSQVRMVKVVWTIRGMAANATTCAPTPDFYIQFDGYSYQDTLGYAPVPCLQGQFSVDKLPTRFDQVEMGVEGGRGNLTIVDPTSGVATFNLAP
ncbi:MAG: hypothetical protein JWO36_194 [Myxococcales bacterium]|nr:hypothetical protein [Myxococcales bacterium]